VIASVTILFSTPREDNKMRNLLLQTAAAAALLMAASPASAGTWVPAHVVKNSTSMAIFGINDKDIITGDYLDASGAQHGFVGPFDGSNYTSFDDPDGTTQPRGLNNKSLIAGFDTGSLQQWERFPKGFMKSIARNGKPVAFALAQGINSAGVFVGDYSNKSGVETGAMGQKAKYTSSFKLSLKNAGYAGRAIDTAGNIAGWYFDTSTGLQRGFVILGGTAKSVDYPNAAYTVGEGLSDGGIMSGQYQDASGTIHGFLYDTSTKKFTSLDAPGATLTQVWGINNNNVVAVSTDVGSFAYCMSKTGCPKAAGVMKTQHVPGRFTPAQP
jgi:hypothetical protein